MHTPLPPRLYHGPGDNINVVNGHDNGDILTKLRNHWFSDKVAPSKSVRSCGLGVEVDVLLRDLQQGVHIRLGEMCVVAAVLQVVLDVVEDRLLRTTFKASASQMNHC